MVVLNELHYSKIRTTPTKCSTKLSEFGETKKIDPFLRVRLFREQTTLSLP